MDFNKKEMPIQGFAGFGGGATSAAFRSSDSTKYVDDVFNTFLYTGANSTNTITTNIDLTTDGGLVWVKRRDGAYKHGLYDTARGVQKIISSDSNAQEATETGGITGFTATGFTTGDANDVNGNTDTYSAWTFKETAGFFDIVTYTGNAGANRQINHSLGCIPGMILVKKLSSTYNSSWEVYHRELNGGVNPANYNMHLNSSDQESTTEAGWNDTVPTATQFTVGINATNAGDETFVAYLFAGGESSAATAVSVDFDATADLLYIGATNDFHLTGDFTIESWIYKDNASANYAICGLGNWQMTGGIEFYTTTDGKVKLYTKNATNDAIRITSNSTLALKQWAHVAIVRSGSTVTMYINGTAEGSYTDSNDFGASNNKNLRIGAAGSNSGANDHLDGKLSNFRIVKGTAVYTSSFRPPTEPLTNITNTKLLCCNNSSTTGSTVTPGTITATGDPTASTQSPFDDPNGFKFGEDGDQNIVKCGSYVGNGALVGPEVFVGWEPQYVLIKRTDADEIWNIFDSMRGIVTQGNDSRLIANSDAAAYTGADRFDVTSTGFRPRNNQTETNASGGTYVYMCVRRPDGYVGKPPELGSGCFQMDTGNTSTTTPNYISGFPVDFALLRKPATAVDWDVTARLTGTKYWKTNTTVGEANYNDYTFDSNTGWAKDNGPGTVQSWMWKRHAGFDVVVYTGDEVLGRPIPHSLNAVPEMMWVKSRSGTEDWAVYHKGLGGGTNPETYYILLNSSAKQVGSNNNRWASTVPTATHFTLGDAGIVNADQEYFAMLFASVDKISKVGYYDGQGSNLTITTGFQPRFLIVKRIETGSDPWFVLDTTRGWASGNDNWLTLDSNNVQASNDLGEPTSTGFVINTGSDAYNNTGNKYIYYCHA